MNAMKNSFCADYALSRLQHRGAEDTEFTENCIGEVALKFLELDCIVSFHQPDNSIQERRIPLLVTQDINAVFMDVEH